jgi:hypothetical protein
MGCRCQTTSSTFQWGFFCSWLQLPANQRLQDTVPAPYLSSITCCCIHQGLRRVLSSAGARVFLLLFHHVHQLLQGATQASSIPAAAGGAQACQGCCSCCLKCPAGLP